MCSSCWRARWRRLRAPPGELGRASLGTDGGVSGWLRARLEATAREVAAEWGVTLGEPFPWAHYSYAAPAGEDAVLKVTPIEDDEADHEADALALWNGSGAVRLLRRDPARRAMLLQRARPGSDASELAEDEATRAAVGVGHALWRPAERGRPFRWIGDEVPRWLGRAPEHRVVLRAKQVFARMAVSDHTLVHGDFHHYNLLRHGDRWLAIDPKPYVGEPEYDVAPVVWQPTPTNPTRDQVERRIAAFVDVGLDADRIREWILVRGAYLAFPLSRDETEDSSPQLRAARLFL